MTTTHPRRRFFRYSLRTLTLGMTLLCVWLTIIANRARDQRLAVEAIQKLGGVVRFEHEGRRSDPPGPAWLRQLIGDEYFFHVAHVRIDSSRNRGNSVATRKQFTDADLGHLTGWTQDFGPWGTFRLTGTQITGAGLLHLKNLTDLRHLYLDDTKINDAGLEHLSSLVNLRRLVLNRTQITGTGLVHLKDLTQLQRLELNNTQITDAALEHLKELTMLQRLHLDNTTISNAGLEHVKELVKHQWRSLSLQVLSLGKTQITDAGLEHLKGMTKLRFLNLGRTQATDAGLVHLKGMTNLQRLDLSNTKIADAGLVYLEKLTNLNFLILYGTQVTTEGAEKLHAVLPNCKIHYGPPSNPQRVENAAAADSQPLR